MAETISEEVRTLREHWGGERIKWSPRHGGCLMWMRGNREWSSQGEGNYPDAASAINALAFYEDKGIEVDWIEHDEQRRLQLFGTWSDGKAWQP